MLEVRDEVFVVCVVGHRGVAVARLATGAAATRMARREAAEAAFERLVFALECQLANGEIDEMQFRVLRDEAFRRLQEAVAE